MTVKIRPNTTLVTGILNSVPNEGMLTFNVKDIGPDEPLMMRRMEPGMSDHQARKWNGWHHHRALAFMASLYLLLSRTENGRQVPLISVRDARTMMIVALFGSEGEMEKRLEQMKIRHLRKVEIY